MSTASVINLVHNPEFSGKEHRIDGWDFTTPRLRLSPRYSILDSGEGKRRLVLSGTGDIHAFGCWRGQADLESGGWYRAGVRVRIRGMDNPHLSVFAQVADHFLLPQETWKEEMVFQRVFRHESSDPASRIELYFRASAHGTAEWFEPCVVRVPEPATRKVRIATVRFGDLKGGISLEAQQQRIASKLEEAGGLKPDLVILPEMAPLIGVLRDMPHPYQAVAEEVSAGPVCRVLSAAAARYGMYVMAGMIERRGDYLYNTAVIFDRQGAFLGQYDKTHLTFEELTQGLSCGTEYPVFDLDFGRIGIHICYDEWFPEVARYYAHQGAEILFLPVAGGKPITWRTRALDNRVYFVASSIGPSSMIIDSSGSVLAEVHDDGIAVMDLNLNERKTNWYRDSTLTHGMPCLWPQMRHTLNDELLKHLYMAMQQPNIFKEDT